MQRYHADGERFMEVMVNDVKGLFSEMRIERESVPKHLYFYEVRHADEDWSEPCQIQRGILVNFFGTLITKEPLLKDCENGLYLENENQWTFLSTRNELGLGYFDKNESNL